ncbi:MAG: DUF481 domain-containing protein [Mariprofundaceae bacterium]|nr:DUF481 domain-containing protein [Mariprofundaceae bacterium]
MKKIILLCCLVFTSTAVWADDATVSEHQYAGKVALGGLKTTGNTTVETFDSQLELNYSYQSWAVDLSFQGEQTSDDGTLIADYYEANLKGIYNAAWQTYAFALLNYREDFFGGIHAETSKLIGLGYHIFPADNIFTADLEIGTGQRQTDKVNKNKLDVDPISHGAIIMRYQPVAEHTFKASITVEDGNDDSFIKKELSWTHTLFAPFEIDFSYAERTLTAPAFGKTGTDSSTSIKLGYAF